MAIGTSGYIEAVHLQQAPLKPDSGLKAAKMFQAVGQLVGASANLYDMYNKPTNEQLVDLRQTFDAGINEITALGEEADYTSSAIADFEDNFNNYLDSLGSSYKEALQGHIYESTKSYYDAPYAVQEKLKIQGDSQAFYDQVNEDINNIKAQGLPKSEEALEVAKLITKTTQGLSSTERVEYGPALQKLVTTANSEAANETGKIAKANKDAKILSGYSAKISQFENGLTASNKTASDKAVQYKAFKDQTLQEVEKNNPDIYASVSKLLDKNHQHYNAAAAKEQNIAERNMVVSGATTQFVNGEKSLEAIMESFSGRQDKPEVQATFLNGYAVHYKDNLVKAAQHKDPKIYLASKALLNKQLDEIRNNIFLGQNNNPDSLKQFGVFSNIIQSSDNAVDSMFKTSVEAEVMGFINTGNFKEAGMSVKKMHDAGFTAQANTLQNKLNTAAKTTTEFTAALQGGLTDPDRPTNFYKGASKEVKERITTFLTDMSDRYLKAISNPANSPELKKEMRDKLISLLNNKADEFKGVQEQFKTRINSMTNVNELSGYASLIDKIGGHNAAIILGQDQVKEINLLSTLVNAMPGLEPGKEINDLRNRLSDAENMTLKGKQVENYKDAMSKAAEIPVPEASEAFKKGAELMYKTLDLGTADKAVEQLFEKMKGSYLEIGSGYVSGVPNTTFQRPAYYEAGVAAVAKQIGGSATLDSLTETHNIQHLPDGDIALIPKTGAGTSTSTIVVSKTEIIKELTNNYDGSPEQYAALRDAYRDQDFTGKAHPADVLHRGWKELNKDTVSGKWDHFTDNVSDSAAAEALNIAADAVAKDAVRSGEVAVAPFEYLGKQWDIFVDDVVNGTESATKKAIDFVDGLIFGEDEEVQP
jgi:hypothetical protein